ncbi:MAG: class I SAM-dependent methyltransferase [Chloroflexi bacterium]|nr:MAG: class I SAM-dependent methyltransferase [Chloroflexota bacterium]MBL1197403.1 class I SAM-dependent methyltransferase [Chloroflexota bacterium]NOH14699.1 class I SAM-dependent methyltransferase [Chloroflexota bacterium]
MNPALYHAHHSRYTEDLPFWLALASEHQRRILELGCGTGRVLQPLLKVGNEVVGLDNDKQMLDYLRDSLPDELSERTKLVEADIIDFQLDQQFGLVLLPCNTFSILDAEERMSALGNIRKHLQDGGVFALSLPNPHALASLPEEGEEDIEDTFSLADDLETSVQVSSAWQREEKTVTLFWHYDVMQPDGNVKRHSASVHQHIVEVEMLEAEFEQAGFDVQARYGDFERSAFDEDSPNLIYVLSNA